MKIFDVFGKVADSGEYILGAEQTGSHACYLIHGVLRPGEQGRELKPGAGHEEIILALTGDILLTGSRSFVLKRGQAAHLTGGESCNAGNPSHSEVMYVIAGGHSGEGHNH